MKECKELDIDDQQIRFTENGQVLLLDAIQMVSGSEHPEELLEELKGHFPHIQNLIQEIELACGPKGKKVPVVSSENWETLLPTLYHFLTGIKKLNLS